MASHQLGILGWGAEMKQWHRLSHYVPLWVNSEAIFHIRIRASQKTKESLISKELGSSLLDSVGFYVAKRNWYCHLWLLMPDHLHGLLVFPSDKNMSRVIGSWKKYHAQSHGVIWQENYFDHRIRNNEEFHQKVE